MSEITVTEEVSFDEARIILAYWTDRLRSAASFGPFPRDLTNTIQIHHTTDYAMKKVMFWKVLVDAMEARRRAVLPCWQCGNPEHLFKDCEYQKGR